MEIEINSVLTVGKIKICRACHRPFRFVAINLGAPMLIDAVDTTSGIGPRLCEHDCGRPESNKALRSTVGHAKMILFRPHTCRCGAVVRKVYLINHDVFLSVDDFGPETPGALTDHKCPKAGDLDD